MRLGRQQDRLVDRPLLQAEALAKRFSGITAVEGVSFEIRAGERVGLLGESGSGKSTLARLMMRLTLCDSGRILFEGQDITRLRERKLRDFRRRVQFIFQDPDAALNPCQTIRASLERANYAAGWTPAEGRERTVRLLASVGLDAAILTRFPRELSGGQKQRVVIARALVPEPSLVVADEPTAALDASVQVQVLNLLRDLQRQRGLAMLVISHDLRTISYLCERIGVLQEGRLVEMGSREEILEHPRHAYTEELLKAFQP